MPARRTILGVFAEHEALLDKVINKLKRGTPT